MPDPVNILVVDDLATQQLTIEATLEDLGERIVCVGSGREALKFLLDQDAAVILLDVNMPEMDGFETATLIRQRQRNAHTPIIFLTADTDELQAARGYELGAVDYLFCPFLPDVLRTKVKVFVTLSRARNQVRREAEQQIALTREQAARAAAEEQSRRLRLLVEAGGLLTRSLDGFAFEGELLGLFVPTLADDAGLVFIDNGHGTGASTWVHADGKGSSSYSTAVPPALADHFTRVLASGRVETLPGPDGSGISGIVLPLLIGTETCGALGMAMLKSGRRYEEADLELIELVAGRASIALDNRRLYRELRERDRRKDEFLAMLSHELRNPLGAITTAVQILDMAVSSEESSTRARRVIARQTFHLARMVDDLLEVSRVTTGRIALTRVPLDMREAVDRAIDALRASGRLDQHDLKVAGERARIQADSARMEQIVTNLLVNAVKYTDPGGTIRVEVGTEGCDAVLRVSDNGIGISPELLPQLFDVFVQGRQSLERAEGGLGIGLTLVKKLVELQGGTIDATSQGRGLGSTFTLRMPLLVEEPPRLEEAPTKSPLPALRVLLVEDNADAREMLHALLRVGGHEVHEAASGPEGVDAAVRIQPHIALVDLGIPGFDGLEVARRLRRDHRAHSILLVALTGYGQPEDRRRTSEIGFDAHLVKPVTFERLNEVLSLAASHARESQESGSPS